MSLTSDPEQTQRTYLTILDKLRRHLPYLQDEYKVKSLGVFGSYVHGKETEESDVDLLIEIDNPTLTLFQFVEMQQQLSDLLGIPVDLVEKDSLKPAIGRRILSEVVPV